MSVLTLSFMVHRYSVLLLDEIDPRTVQDRGIKWSVDCMFSLTKSTSDKAIRAAAMIVSDDDGVHDDFESVSSFV